jgi:hypothetical protein
LLEASQRLAALHQWREIMIRIIASAILALSFVGGATSVMAVENDNDRSTYSAKEFYEKLDQQGGSGGN